MECLGDAARRARECAVMGQAVTLARWIGSGRRPVTAGQVLRKADVPAAGAALRVDVPARLRTMAETVPRDHSQVYPVCVAFRGDSPVEYWSEEEPEEPDPFGMKEVNRRLAALGREPA
jgi:hypothetical protein